MRFVPEANSAARVRSGPGKIIAYDSEDRVVGVTVLGGPGKPAPCPPARIAKRHAAERPPAPYERLDLGARTVNGAPIFGRSPAAIEAALGRPDRVRFGNREPTFYYNPRGPADADLTVRFGWRQQRTRAITLHYRSANVLDAKLGQLLRQQPEDIQRRIVSVYRSRYDLELAYGSEPGRGCLAEFASANKRVRLRFGVEPYAGGRPFLEFSHGY